MTKFPLLIIGLLGTTPVTLAQSIQPSSAAVTTATAPSARTPFVAVRRMQDQMIWESYNLRTNRAGVISLQTNRYVELETGKHYLSDGKWRETSEEIQLAPEGAVAANGPHKASFAVNINSRVSVVVRTPVGALLKIRPAALAYYDFHSRTNVLIAELKEADGFLVGSNQVVYPDAFTDFKADIRYTYSKSGFEQDVIIRQRPPAPEMYGLNPNTTWLMVLTEFIDPPADVQPVREVRKGWKKSTVDKMVKLGGMTIGHGTAFGLGLGEDRTAGVPVQKHWTVLDGRTFLIEEVSYLRVVPSLKKLQASATQPSRAGAVVVQHRPSSSLVIPAPQTASTRATKTIKVASAPVKTDGLVLDFDLQTGNNIVLAADTTYRVRGTVNLTDSTIEGGTVVKFDREARLNLYGTVQCLTGPYRPAVFTAVDDNSVGECIGTGSPTGRYADCALSLQTGADLKYVNIRFAKDAIFCGNNPYSVRHAQILFCDVGLHSETADFYAGNILAHQLVTMFYGSHFNGRAEHLTVDQASMLMGDWDFSFEAYCEGNPSSSLSLVNTLTASMTNGYAAYPINLAIYDGGGVRNYATGEGVFQRAGYGAHYLVENSDNRNVGTTAIHPILLAELKQKTTYAPVVYSNIQFTVSTKLDPRAQRDTDLPDLGYHYEPLDYLVTRVFMGSTGQGVLHELSVGTAIGTYGDYGILCGAQFLCRGTSTSLNHIARFNMVQELSGGNGGCSWRGSSILAPSVFGTSFQFTDWSAPAQDGAHIQDTDSMGNPAGIYNAFANCQFHGGGVQVYRANSYFTNCLFERVASLIDDDISGATYSLVVRNSLLYGGSLTFNHTLYSSWQFRDCLFDNTSILNTYGASIDNDHNGYLTGSTRLTPVGNTDVVTDLTYRSGPLGHYYQPISSGFINHGSTNAHLLGLYHYTVTTNLVNGVQLKETNSVVDIGFHYVATANNGSPIDTDGDGVPDYAEDTNGNGIWTDDPTSWKDYNSVNGLVITDRLQVFTPLK